MSHSPKSYIHALVLLAVDNERRGIHCSSFRRAGMNLIVLLVWLVCSTANATDFIGVPRIVDGDTLAIGSTKFRLEGIDAPKTDQVCLNASGERWTCGLQCLYALSHPKAPSCASHEYNIKLIIYPAHVTTRKSLGLMMRKLSVTESQRSAQFRGTVSRKKPSVASANWVQVA